MVIFDPPHLWGKKIGDYLGTIRNREEAKAFYPERSKGSTYYGWDKYQTKSALLGFINRAQKEFARVLMENGVLWLKWNECGIPYRNISSLFRDWDEMLKFKVQSRFQTRGKTQTWWIMFMKKFVV